MEPLRQGRTQKTLIWEEKDFSSKLWEITTLLRMTYFLQERGYKFWFSLNVLSTCTCNNLLCLSYVERQAGLQAGPWQQIRRGDRAWRSRHESEPHCPPSASRFTGRGCQPAAARSAARVRVWGAGTRAADRHPKMKHSNGRKAETHTHGLPGTGPRAGQLWQRPAPPACPLRPHPGPQGLLRSHPGSGVRASGYFVTGSKEF